MGEKQRVGVVFGGSSVEHEVSVVSARGVRRGLEAGPFDCVPIGVTEEGRWLAPELSEPILSGEQPRVEIRSGGPPAAELQIDPVDKEISKSLFEYHGLPVGPWTSFRQDEYRRDPEGTLARVGETLGFPVFVKPANGGSSVGVSRVDGPDALPGAVDTALGCDPKGVVEADLRAREIECAVIGNDDPEASVPGEILPSREFYDYASKYEDGTSVLVIPAEVPEDVEAEIRAVAVRAFRVLDLAGLARVDFFLQRDGGRVYLNEVNTLPGFTPISMFPKLWEASGVSYPRLLERLVSLALERWNEQRGRATRRGT
jgi:D-alanine-D-alanine ligase